MQDPSHLTKELEQANQQLEQIQQDLNQFVYSVSHTISAPVRHMKGYATWLLEDEGDVLSINAKENLEKIIHTAERYSSMVTDLVNYMRMSKVVPNKSWIDFLPIMENIRQKYEAQGRNIQWRFPSSIKGYADSGMMTHLFDILFSNAVKFSSKEELAIIRVEVEEEEREMVYSISDNGVGFEMTYANRLFQVFQRLHTRREFEGNGVGLAQAKNIIDLHGGRIWVHAIPDESANIFFSLPKDD